MTADARDDDSFHALPAGTRFGELEILGTLGVGGFGIVYLARDHSLEREIAIKEYMPSQFAQRDGQSQVSVRSVSMAETFELGRRSFVNEAKLLARFDHPSLLKVYRFWEANGTAYMAMPRLVGQSLREARKARPTPPPEDWLRRIFDAVLGGLETLHAQNVWHRDVAPDNIFLPADGSPPILLDFGAARQAIGDRTQVFTAILKPSYAPIEQYAEAAGLKQGPWTDFYALAAAMHDLLTGRPPPPCTARAMADELMPLSVPGYSPSFLAGLDWALRVSPQQRPQSVAAWRAVVEGRAVAPPRPAPPPAMGLPLDLEFADTVQVMPDEDPAATVVPAKPPVAGRPAPVAKPTPPAAQPPAPAQAKAARPSRTVLAGGALVAVLLLGFFVMQVKNLGKPAAPVPPPEAAIAAASAVPAASVPEAVPVSDAASAAAVPASALEPQAPITAPLVAQARPQPASAPAAANRPARRDGAARSVTTEKAADVRPVARSPVFAAPEPAAEPVVSAVARPASAESAEPTSPAEACGKRVLLAKAWCIDRQCERPLFQNHAECVRLREIRNQNRVP
ncbi:serine/threonine protein kinase [Roseateles sp. DC23W]|uniref:non-specific serine/threonine protein kinase n=1 Tax=Pelomonas dachongensis TaxID=3299029 RepID=A0ABW7ERL5_9BURK